MKRSYGYSAYRGRNKGRKALLVLIAVLVFVLIAVLAAFFLLQSHIYFGDDGKAHIELSGQKPEESPPASSAGEVIIVTPSPEPTLSPRAVLALAELPAEEIDTAAETAAAQGANGALFVMKRTDGRLTYVSDLPQAVSMGTGGADVSRNEALRAMNEAEGLYTVAKVSCFRDDRAPRMNNALALRSYAGNWLDREGIRWLNPAVPETRAYLVGICRELAGLGFDEIWLVAPCYPVNGELVNIRVGETYDPEDLSGPVAAFYEEVRTALADYPDVKVSYSASAAVVTGEGDKSGQTMELLKEYAYRLYIPAPDSGEAAAAYREALEGMAAPVYTTTSAFLDEAPAGGSVRAAGEG